MIRVNLPEELPTPPLHQGFTKAACNELVLEDVPGFNVAPGIALVLNMHKEKGLA